MNCLVLPPNYTGDDQAIWRAAIQRPWWTTFRGLEPESYVLPRVDRHVYYGNVLHRERLRGTLPLRARQLNPQWVTKVDQAAVFGRSIEVMTLSVFYHKYLSSQTKVFVKQTGVKWFKPQVCLPSELDVMSAQPEDILHVQEVMPFWDEVRCWVLDGLIMTCSYYRKQGRPWNGGEAEVLPRWRELVRSIAHALPSAVVIDIGSTVETGQWWVIEANEPWASGIYDCDPQCCLDVIDASQTNTCHQDHSY